MRLISPDASAVSVPWVNRISQAAALLTGFSVAPLAGPLPSGPIETKPDSYEVESSVQIGGNQFGHYNFVGELRCTTGEALVGVRMRRSTVVESLEIGCAPLRCTRDICVWDGAPRWQMPVGGEHGSGQMLEMRCNPGDMIMGFSGRDNLQTSEGVHTLDFATDLAFMCARIGAPPEPGNPRLIPLTLLEKPTYYATYNTRSYAGKTWWCPTTTYGATALSVGIGRYQGRSVVQAFTMFCGMPIDLAPPYRQMSHIDHRCLPEHQRDWRAFEQCLLLTIEGSRLPLLRQGRLETWGRSDPSFNCYGYAVNRHAPQHRWVGQRTSGTPLPGDDPINSQSGKDVYAYFRKQGWAAVPFSKAPPLPGEERVVIYATRDGVPQHAAVWASDGVFAKMGELGTFRFASIDQMGGGAFGEPAVMFRRNVP